MKINLLFRPFSVRTKHAYPTAGEAGNHGEYHTRIRQMVFIPLISSEPRPIPRFIFFNLHTVCVTQIFTEFTLV